MKDKLIEVKHIKKYFPVGRDAFLHAVDDVSFDIEKALSARVVPANPQ